MHENGRGLRDEGAAPGSLQIDTGSTCVGDPNTWESHYSLFSYIHGYIIEYNT